MGLPDDERERERTAVLGDYIGKMVRLLERKAKQAGVTREEYLAGMVNGKYPQPRRRS